MANKKTKKNKSVIKVQDQPITELKTSSSKRKIPFSLKLAIVVLIGVSAFWLIRKYRGSIIAAVVNKTPIPRYKLNQVLLNRYGQAVLDEIIAEELLNQLSAREKITISTDEIQKERDSLKERLGGEDSLKQALEQYGLTETDLTNQIKLRLTQQKLSDKLFKVEVKDDEIKTFFADNKELYAGKKLEDVKDEIKESLVSQKAQQEFSTWFEEEKGKAQIQTFIQ